MSALPPEGVPEVRVVRDLHDAPELTLWPSRPFRPSPPFGGFAFAGVVQFERALREGIRRVKEKR